MASLKEVVRYLNNLGVDKLDSTMASGYQVSFYTVRSNPPNVTYSSPSTNRVTVEHVRLGVFQ